MPTSHNLRSTNHFRVTIPLPRSIAVIILLLICLPGCDTEPTADKTLADVSFSIDREHTKGPLIVHVKLDRDNISIAETVNLRLEADIEPGYDVKMPSLAEVIGKYEFGILDYRALPDKLLDNGHLLLVRQYRLEPILSGEYAIGSLNFIFTEQSGDPATTEPHHYELVTDEIPIEVTSLLDEDRDDLAIADIRTVVPLPRRYNLTWLWIAAPVGVLALALLIWLLKRKRAEALLKRIFKPAHELAYQRLRQLEQEDLVTAGRAKEFYSRASGILRHYIEDRFKIRAPEQTTEEFLAASQSTDRLSDTQSETLNNFLVHCDQVKFARYAPSADEAAKTVTLTREFIDGTRAPDVQVDVTDQPDSNPTEAVGRNA